MAIFPIPALRKIVVLIFVRYGQFRSALRPASGKDFPSILCCHSGTKSMFVFSLSVRGLECSFHIFVLLFDFNLNFSAVIFICNCRFSLIADEKGTRYC